MIYALITIIYLKIKNVLILIIVQNHSLFPVRNALRDIIILKMIIYAQKKKMSFDAAVDYFKAIMEEE